MINSVIKAVASALVSAGAENVYSAFDAVPVEQKSRGIFTTVGISSLECSAPISSAYTIFMPFKADVAVNVTAPRGFSEKALFDYYSSYIETALGRLSGLESRLKKLSVKYDSNINRLVLGAVFGIGGMTTIERSGK